MRQGERGASLFSTLIVLLMAGSLFSIAFKIYPPYTDHLTIQSVMENIVNDTDEIRKPVATIRQDINKRLHINQVRLPSAEALEIVKDRGVLKFNLNYEVRVPMFFNVDAVVKFSEAYEAVVP